MLVQQSDELLPNCARRAENTYFDHLSPGSFARRTSTHLYADTAHTPSASLFDLRKAFEQIRDQIPGMLAAWREPYECIREAELCAFLGGDRRVRHPRGMTDERF